MWPHRSVQDFVIRRCGDFSEAYHTPLVRTEINLWRISHKRQRDCAIFHAYRSRLLNVIGICWRSFGARVGTTVALINSGGWARGAVIRIFHFI